MNASRLTPCLKVSQSANATNNGCPCLHILLMANQITINKNSAVSHDRSKMVFRAVQLQGPSNVVVRNMRNYKLNIYVFQIRKTIELRIMCNLVDANPSVPCVVVHTWCALASKHLCTPYKCSPSMCIYRPRPRLPPCLLPESTRVNPSVKVKRVLSKMRFVPCCRRQGCV